MSSGRVQEKEQGSTRAVEHESVIHNSERNTYKSQEKEHATLRRDAMSVVRLQQSTRRFKMAQKMTRLNAMRAIDRKPTQC